MAKQLDTSSTNSISTSKTAISKELNETLFSAQESVDFDDSFDLDDSSDEEGEASPAGPSFNDFGLSDTTLSSLEKLGFTVPTPVQVQTIPLLLGDDTDLIALAKTGTGKTGAFGIPLVEKLEKKSEVQALVLCPTRELATQVATNLQSFGLSKGMKVAAVVGGESYRRQIDALNRGPQIVVSTPGRLVDLMDQGIIDLSFVKYFILDEADEMLSFGFKESLETIWQALGTANKPKKSSKKKIEEEIEAQDEQSSKESKKVFTWLFSATMSESIYRLTSEYLQDPVEIKLNQNTEPIKVDSFAAVMYQEEKEDALCLAILAATDFYGIIFAQTKQQVAQLELKLRSFGIEVDSLHGDKVQAERTRTIKRFKSRETQILVATDVAARGLDVEDLTHVVNFELPWDAETYTHRIGRTARAGKQGTVWNFVSPKEANLLRRFEQRLKVQFKPLQVPTRQQVDELIIRNWIKSVIVTKDYDREFKSLESALSGVESGEEISFDAKNWLAKVIKFLKIGAPAGLRTPRLLELHPQRSRPATSARSSSGPRMRNDKYGRGYSRGEGAPSDRREMRSESRGESRSAESRGASRDSREGGEFRPRREGSRRGEFPRSHSSDVGREDSRRGSFASRERSDFSRGRSESRSEGGRSEGRFSQKSESSFRRGASAERSRDDRNSSKSGRPSFRDKFKSRD